MATVTYIIPIHKFDAIVSARLPEALESIKASDDNDYTISLVGPKEILGKAEKVIKKLKLEEVTKYVENEDTDVYTQINVAVLRCTSPYFCVVEYDDKITPYWERRAKEYGKNGASVLLPLNNFFESGNFVSLGNELAWDVSFADENNLGYITDKELNVYMDFPVHGAFIKTEDFITIGGL